MSDLPGDTVTILKTKGTLVAAKRVRRRAGQPDEIVQYDNAKHFSVQERVVRGIYEAAALLSKMQRYPRFMVIRGRVLAGVDRNCVTRTYLNGPDQVACFEPAAHQLILLDCDKIACPEGLDPLADPAAAVRLAVALLPPEFRDVACWWQFTSSAGLVPGIRLRLAFWGSRPTSDRELKGWLPKTVDHAVFGPVQAIYIANPIFEEGDDPVPIRSGVCRSANDEVEVPDEIATQPEAPPGVGEPAVCDGLDPYGEAALLSAAEVIMAAADGEQESTLNGQAFAIGRLAGAGGAPPDLALDVLLTAARAMHSFARPWTPAEVETKVRRAFAQGLAKPRRTLADVEAEFDRAMEAVDG